MLFDRDSKFGRILIAVDLDFGPMRTKKKAIKRIARDSKMLVVLADKEDPEKMVLAYAPIDVSMPKAIAHLEVV